MGEPLRLDQCPKILYPTYGLGREGIQGTPYAIAQNGPASLGQQTLPCGLAPTKSNGLTQVAVAGRLLGRE